MRFVDRHGLGDLFDLIRGEAAWRLKLLNFALCWSLFMALAHWAIAIDQNHGPSTATDGHVFVQLVTYGITFVVPTALCVIVHFIIGGLTGGWEAEEVDQATKDKADKEFELDVERRYGWSDPSGPQDAHYVAAMEHRYGEAWRDRWK